MWLRQFGWKSETVGYKRFERIFTLEGHCDEVSTCRKPGMNELLSGGDDGLLNVGLFPTAIS
jgi:hypothetical protein